MASRENTNPSSFDSADMASRGRIGGYARAAKYAPEELPGKARAVFLKRSGPQDTSLPSEERHQPAKVAVRAHLSELGR